MLAGRKVSKTPAITTNGAFFFLKALLPEKTDEDQERKLTQRNAITYANKRNAYKSESVIKNRVIMPIK